MGVGFPGSHIKKPGVARHAGNPWAGEAEMEGSLELAGQSVNLHQ